ncbi:major facilitator superfamily domain-containing protein [Boeremia exigua]|uniref:major facilitator superfamily domain-containing protein n=1 Tax=Boeremia exigua TaxID=749465 RepID=UPI001E8D9954|nr:major facilitator superfamily domain-containing protein [Boeremia exigua]KAH6616644.1 major facilitator superfamily domain-containing protein [Boeremia exigua]
MASKHPTSHEDTSPSDPITSQEKSSATVQASGRAVDDFRKPPLESDTPGVKKVERFSHVLYHSGTAGRLLLYVLAASIGLTMFGYALDQGITSQFTVIAASSLGHHAEISAVSTAASIIRAISKPFIGKLSDITSRPTCYLIVLIFYVIGFVVAATCNDIAAYVIGISFTAFGKSGLDLLGDTIVADLTPLEWRAFWSGLLSSPFIITVFINGFIADAMIPDNWRWGLGMFAIMMPVLLIPAILTLYGVQRRADKLGAISFGEAGMARREGIKVHTGKDYLNLAWRSIIEIDLAGLVLLGFGFALVLLSFNLAKTAKGGWSNPSMVAMLVVGFIILGLFAAFEIMIAPKPIMTRRIFRNKAFICALIVDVAGQMASSTRATYFSSYMYIIKNWSNYAWNTFLNITTLVLCLFGPLGGIIHRISHRYKTLMVLGAVLRLVGNGILMTADTRSTQDTATLVVSQLLLGCGAFTVIGARVGSQASVPHEDLSSAIAIIALWSTLASSVGSTIAGSIWQDKMLPYMREEMPDVPEKTLKTIYGSIRKLRAEYTWDDPIRKGAVRAYTRVNGILFLVAVVLNILPVVFSLCMPDYYLGKQQNAVTNKGVDGQLVQVEQRVQSTDKTGTWVKIKNIYRKET